MCSIVSIRTSDFELPDRSALHATPWQRRLTKIKKNVIAPHFGVESGKYFKVGSVSQVAVKVISTQSATCLTFMSGFPR